MSGVYREIAPLERLVFTEVWDADWTGGEALVTIVFAEHAGKTTHAHADGALLLSHRPDAVRKTPKEHGVTRIYNRLAELLALKKEQEN